MKRIMILLMTAGLSLNASADCIEQLERALDNHKKNNTKTEKVVTTGLVAGSIAGAVILNPVLGAVWGAGVLGVQVYNLIEPSRFRKSAKIIKDAYNYLQTGESTGALRIAHRRFNRIRKKNIKHINKYLRDSGRKDLKFESSSLERVAQKIVEHNEKGEECVLKPKKLMQAL